MRDEESTTHSSPGVTTRSRVSQSPATPCSSTSSSRRGGRVSPYRQRSRGTTPSPRADASLRGSGARAPSAARRRATGEPAARSSDRPGPATFQLLVEPVVKTTVHQRDTSGETLDVFVASGATFTDILKQLWDKYIDRVKGREMRSGTTWSIVRPEMEQWNKVLKLKAKKYVVDTSKTEQQWNRWLVDCRGETVLLLIYEYGTTIKKADDHQAFTAACVRPISTDRAGATAEEPLQDVVSRVQERWSSTFQAEAAVWRMWANHITRNLNRSTWEDLINQPPPDYVAVLLRPADLPSDRQLASISRSTSVALDCVAASTADLHDLRETLNRRIDLYERSLAARQRVLEGIVRDARLPTVTQVIDPIQMMENVADTEHQE